MFTHLICFKEQIRAEQSDITHQREQLYRKMEILTNQGLLISPNVALPVTGQLEDSSNHSSEESSPQSEGSGIATGGASSGGSSVHSTTERRKDTKWSKGSIVIKLQNDTLIWLINFISGSTKSQLPINLISTTNQQKVSQVPIKQQIPLKLASRLSSGSSSTNTATTPSSGRPQQMLPLKLSQEEKIRRTSTGYQRLGSDSLSPTSGETVITWLIIIIFFNTLLFRFRLLLLNPRTVVLVRVRPWCKRLHLERYTLFQQLLKQI